MQPIRSATVIGSGIMGSQIAAHLAGCGIPVLLLDVPTEGKDRNAVANKGRDGLKKVKPSPLYSAEALDLITTGNTADHLAEAGQTDWIIEAIIEQPKPKQELFRKLAPHMGPDTILATNTSGIPLKVLGEGLPESVQQRFIATHFFNPPRYLRLVEVIRGPKTTQKTADRIEHVLNSVLNKVPVPALDSPTFIANRIGVQAMVATVKIAKELGLSVEEVDALPDGAPQDRHLQTGRSGRDRYLGTYHQWAQAGLPGRGFRHRPDHPGPDRQEVLRAQIQCGLLQEG
jgi:3-hydroxyacyl-CoA dehydrogenase